MRRLHQQLFSSLSMLLLYSTVLAQAQPRLSAQENDKPITITGVRFSYPLIQKWIDEYKTLEPDIKIVIEPRSTVDPSSYDILAEAYEQGDELKRVRDYVYVARYPILAVANSKSAFARYYTAEGLTRQLLTELFFHDITSEKNQPIRFNYTIYNRLQRAGAPIVFTKYFGYAQKDIRGKAIAGSDEHLLKAILRDSLAVSYLPLTLIYQLNNNKIVEGLTVLPADLDGNGKVTEDEKFYASLSNVIERLEDDQTKVNNIPIGYLHLSIAKTTQRPEAVAFLKWVAAHGQEHTARLGYLSPGTSIQNSGVFLSPPSD